jgi:hypothetical protein
MARERPETAWAVRFAVVYEDGVFKPKEPVALPAGPTARL